MKRFRIGAQIRAASWLAARLAPRWRRSTKNRRPSATQASPLTGGPNAGLISARLLSLIFVLVAVIGLAAGLAWAQRYRGGGPYRGQYADAKGGWVRDRGGVPEWEMDPEFKGDVFTFARVMYDSYGRGGYGGARWAIDWPASDLNFSFRLQQLTSMKVNPATRYLPLTDPELFDFPFIYMVEPGALVFSEEEVKTLRRYLDNGGFLMVDDFWGQDEWYNFYVEIRRVFPDREPRELPLEHPIFHCVYDLKEKPQIPSIGQAQGGRYSGRTWERHDAETPHYKAIFDDDGRMAVIICHNTDLGDGWEREGEDPWYFHQFSEKYAYPLGINIVTYAMTH